MQANKPISSRPTKDEFVQNSLQIVPIPSIKSASYLNKSLQLASVLVLEYKLSSCNTLVADKSKQNLIANLTKLYFI